MKEKIIEFMFKNLYERIDMITSASTYDEQHMIEKLICESAEHLHEFVKEAILP